MYDVKGLPGLLFSCLVQKTHARSSCHREHSHDMSHEALLSASVLLSLSLIPSSLSIFVLLSNHTAFLLDVLVPHLPVISFRLYSEFHRRAFSSLTVAHFGVLQMIRCLCIFAHSEHAACTTLINFAVIQLGHEYLHSVVSVQHPEGKSN